MFEVFWQRKVVAQAMTSFFSFVSSRGCSGFSYRDLVKKKSEMKCFVLEFCVCFKFEVSAEK